MSPMTWIAVVVTGAALVALTLLALASAQRARREVQRTRAEAAGLRGALADLDARVSALGEPAEAPGSTGGGTEPDYVITALADPEHRDQHGPGPEAVRLEGRLFTDIVVRETVVKAAALGHGVRRALSPEGRNRLWFEYRQEVAASRKQRRAERKAAMRAGRRALREQQASPSAARIDDDEDAA